MSKINRRDFLKMLGIGAGAVAAGSAWIKPLPVDMSKQGREDEVEEIKQAVQEIKDEGGYTDVHENPYFVDGGVSVRWSTRYATWNMPNRYPNPINGIESPATWRCEYCRSLVPLGMLRCPSCGGQRSTGV